MSQAPGQLLRSAITAGSPRGVTQALRAGADVDGLLELGATPLETAARCRNEEAFLQLLDAGASIVNKRRITYLFEVTWSPLLTEALLQRGADPRQRHPDGYDAVYVCAVEGHPKTMRMLAEAGADMNSVCSRHGAQVPALFRCAERWDERMVKVMLDAGADARARDRQGATVMHYVGKHTAFTRHLTIGEQEDLRQTIRLLAGAGSGFDTGTGGSTLLHEAARHVSGALVQILLEAGVPAHAVNDAGQSAGDVAVEAGNTEHWLLIRRFRPAPVVTVPSDR